MASVLIATDDAALAHILWSEIEGMGFEALWEVAGHTAFDTAIAHQPSVVLLDVNLPVHTGLELAALLRADPDLPRGLPVFLLTDDAVEPHTLERNGVTDVFPKTHDAAMLRELVVAAVHTV
jgi:CheY-like chemotaxis protein